jgi:hypothetical protein
MAHTPDRCEHDGIKWFPRVTVEKYSPDQSAWADRRLHDELSWGRRLLVARLGARVPRLHGDWLREVFREPEDGFAYAEGNSLVNNGLDALGNLVVGSGTPQSFAPGGVIHAICGVGDNAGAFVVTSPALLGDGSTSHAFYQAMDATYPAVDGTTHGQLNGQSTFISTSANFATGWVEWCWATSTVAIGASTGGTLATLTAGTEVLFNRWTGTTLGTKGAGATWVFSTTISFSLSQVRGIIRTIVSDKNEDCHLAADAEILEEAALIIARSFKPESLVRWFIMGLLVRSLTKYAESLRGRGVSRG